jgi:hypothetical protein
MKRVAALLSTTIGNVRIVAVLPVLAAFLGARRLVVVIEDASWGAGAVRARYSLALLLVAVALAVLAESRYLLRNTRARTLGIAGALLLCCLCFPTVREQVGVVAWRFGSPHLIDIPITTMAAARTMASGENPYKVAVDPRAESREQGRNYDGFKYMPLMAVVYSPAALARSERSVILINACLHLLTATLVFFVARSLSGDIAASLGLLFYLWTRMLPRQLFGPGVTDLAAVAPLLAAFWAGEAFPFLSGLLVGVSVSTKILPALALVPLFAPAANPLRDRNGARFWLGLACGCVPTLVYFAWSPADFTSNVVCFSLFRPVDSTSWLDGHPASWRQGATAVLLLLVAGVSLLRWIRRPAPRGRAVLILVVIVGLTLLGPVNHGNYQLWWIPWTSVVLAFSLGVYLYPVDREIRSGRISIPATTRLD